MYLSTLTFLPLLFALIIMLLPVDKYIKPAAVIMSLVLFAFSLMLFGRFDPNTADLQLVEKFPWIESFGISYFLGIDGISLWLVMLTTFLLPLTVIYSVKVVNKSVRTFYVCLFALTTTMVGTFLAFDAILFYTFFEASLVPMYLLIGIWGGKRKIYATVKFFIFTMAGSVFMLVGIIALMLMTSAGGQPISASLLDFYKLDLPFVAGEFLSTQTLLFFAFSIAFAIKVPMFPVHTWLPDAHVEAPTIGSVILAGVMLKMGTYGFLRIVIPMFPEAASYWSWLFLFLGVVGIVYGAMVAMVQTDVKKLVAYSSVSHMGYVMIGLFALNTSGVTGALYQMLNHGVSTGALFLLVGMIYERTHSREISEYGGLASKAPVYTVLFLIITFSSIAVPMTNGFVGEFLILLGTYQANRVFGMIAVLGVILGASYMLWMVKRMFFGPEGNLVKKAGKSLDISFLEGAVLVPIVVLVFWMGIYPDSFLKWSNKSIEHLVENKSTYELK